MLVQQKHQIVAMFEAALAPLVAGSGLAPTVTLERPRDPSHGDVACNIAMQLAKPLKKNPRELAQALVASVRANPSGAQLIDSIDIAGPGFINLRLSQAARQAVVKAVLEEGALYGKNRDGAGSKVLVEFVSANPTGPLHVGHGRQGALGDALAALLESQGHDVTREFYYNDAGVQIATLANSVQARARGFQPGDAQWPENA
jgi:arginyl-tRNA synthetase